MSGDVTGGSFPLAGDLTVTRMGFGAMQLAGPGAWGPPRDRGEAIRVLRTVAELGLTHIDTSCYYGPNTVNEVIREALHPYPDDLHIVTKVGFRRNADRAWLPAITRRSSSRRSTPISSSWAWKPWTWSISGSAPPRWGRPGSIAGPFGVLAGLQSQGLIRYLGLSNVTADQLAEAQAIGRVVCVQNRYNLAHRRDDPLLDRCAELGIAFVRSTRSAVSPRCRPAGSATSRPGWVPRRTRSCWPGCCTAPQISCSSRVPRRSGACATMPPPPP